MTWPHKLTIAGPTTGGTQNADGGWDPGSAGDPIYDGKCDAQEQNRGGLKVTTGDTEIRTETAELMIFLKDESVIKDLEPGMTGTLTRKDQTDKITITTVRKIDGSIEANTI